MLAERCPFCGVQYGRLGLWWWRVPHEGLSPRDSGWGLSSATYKSRTFRLISLLVPIWLPPIIALMADEQPDGKPWAFVLLLAPFIFIPGVYVISNLPGWSGPIRFITSLVYVVLASIVGFAVLSQFFELLRHL